VVVADERKMENAFRDYQGVLKKRHQISTTKMWRKIFFVKKAELHEEGGLLLFRQKLNF